MTDNDTVLRGPVASNTFDAVDLWLDRNGRAGHDVCDVKSTALYKWVNVSAQNSRLLKLCAYYPMAVAELYVSGLVRKACRIEKRIYPQALAQMARAHLLMGDVHDQAQHREKAVAILSWLLENHSAGYTGITWGQPYDWPSRILIPADTLRATVTSIVSAAFLDAYDRTGDQVYLDTVASACRMFIADFNYERDADGDLCFSYTTLDNFRVHNANMFAVETLLRTWSHTRDAELFDVGMAGFRLTMKCQEEDGAWRYCAPPEDPGRIDNYHTGFLLESLVRVKRALGPEFAWDESLRRGAEFFLKNFFLEDGTPKMKPASVYPIDIQSCAQSIITLCELGSVLPSMSQQLRKQALLVTEWTTTHMMGADGGFYYRKYRNGWTDRTPYIRWGQSWMLRALAYVIKSESIDNTQAGVTDT